MKTFKNRHGEDITFIKNGDEIEMNGGEYYRYIYSHEEPNDDYYAVDPSGGPFISVGMDMGFIHEDFKGLVVESIYIAEKIVLKIK